MVARLHERRFCSWRRTSRRLLRAFGCMPSSAMLRAVVPLNLGYRLRHRSYRTFEKAAAFVPSQAYRWAVGDPVAFALGAQATLGPVVDAPALAGSTSCACAALLRGGPEDAIDRAFLEGGLRERASRRARE